MSSVTDEIKSRVDLVDLIGHTVELKRAGQYYKGLCPFHAEKTPSFYVRPQTQTWHCYGCGKWGTAFDWLMEREHLDFGEALRTLAGITGVQLPERHTAAEDDHARRLFTILERAQTYYAGLFWGAAGQRARDYLLGRGLTDDTLRLFGVGYAGSGNGLLRYLEKDGFSEQELQAAGVIGVTEDEGRPYDFFRDRVLFPIRDAQGRPIAFGGRALDDSATPKYLNSRDTLLFHKQETLFAFDLARKAMSQDRQVVIVEGYMDAAMAHQHGYRNVVATLGTAVTDRHLRLLRRQVDEIVLALDADAAGDAAMWRAWQQADESLRTGIKPVVTADRRQQRIAPGHWVKLKILVLPGAKDPDDFIRSNPGAWPTLVRDAMPVIDFVLKRSGERHDLRSPQGKRAAAEEMIEVLAGIADPIEQDHFINEVATLIGARSETIRGLLRRTVQPRRPSPAKTTAPAPTQSVVGHPLDDNLLGLLMRLRELSAPEPAELDFLVPESRALHRVLGSPIPPELEPHAERARRKLADARRLSPQELARDIEDTRRSIRTEVLERTRREINALGDDAEVRNFLDKLDEVRKSIGAIEQQLSPEQESAGTR